MWKVTLSGRVLTRDQNWTIDGPRRSGGGHCMCHSDRGDSVRLFRQDDPVPVVVGRDKFDGVLSGHPVTVGRKTGTQCSEDEEHETRQQPVG